jgi:hypothetical protein
MLKLINYTTATDVSYDKLIEFLESDKTDKNQYIINKYMCGDFSEDLHNNAEEYGIRCAVVIMRFFDSQDHAINAFNTTDKGLIFIDQTVGDSPVTVEKGKQYRNIGELISLEVYW